jgi:hypothetical protein
LVAWKAATLARHELFVDYMTGLIVGAEYNTQKTLLGIPAMVMA